MRCCLCLVVLLAITSDANGEPIDLLRAAVHFAPETNLVTVQMEFDRPPDLFEDHISWSASYREPGRLGDGYYFWLINTDTTGHPAGAFRSGTSVDRRIDAGWPYVDVYEEWGPSYPVAHSLDNSLLSFTFPMSDMGMPSTYFYWWANDEFGGIGGIPLPEPSSLALVLIGVVGSLVRRVRRRPGCSAAPKIMSTGTEQTTPAA